jgi:hypothetical protein
VRKHITCEADLNFPGPTAEAVAAQVRALCRGNEPVTTAAVARAIGADCRAVEDSLRRARRAGLVRHVAGRGWIPPTT